MTSNLARNLSALMRAMHLAILRSNRHKRVWLVVMAIVAAAGSVQCGGTTDPDSPDLGLLGVFVGAEPNRTQIQTTKPKYPVYRVLGKSAARATNIWLSVGEQFHVSTIGKVRFDGATSAKISPDGVSGASPSDFPGPQLVKYSLLCRVGSVTLQCGTSKTMTVQEAGQLTLLANDATPANNSGAWAARITPSDTDPNDIFGSYNVLPDPSFRVDLRASPFGTLSVKYGQAALPELPAGALKQATSDGWWDDYASADDPGRLQVTISPPMNARNTSSVVEFQLSTNDGQGGTQLSRPLGVPISAPQSTGEIHIEGTYTGRCGPEFSTIGGGPEFTGAEPPPLASIIGGGLVDESAYGFHIQYERDIFGNTPADFDNSYAGMGVPGYITGTQGRYYDPKWGYYCPFPSPEVVLRWASSP